MLDGLAWEVLGYICIYTDICVYIYIYRTKCMNQTRVTQQRKGNHTTIFKKIGCTFISAKKPVKQCQMFSARSVRWSKPRGQAGGQKKGDRETTQNGDCSGPNERIDIHWSWGGGATSHIRYHKIIKANTVLFRHTCGACKRLQGAGWIRARASWAQSLIDERLSDI